MCLDLHCWGLKATVFASHVPVCLAEGLDLLGREDDPSCGLRCAQCYRSEVRGDAQAGLVLNITNYKCGDIA